MMKRLSESCTTQINVGLQCCFVRRTKSSKNHIIIITDLIWAKDTFVSPYGKETMKTIQLGYGVLHVILHHQLET